MKRKRKKSEASEVQSKKKKNLKKSINEESESKLLRLEKKDRNHVWIKIDDILFAESNDHYVNILVLENNEVVNMTRHTSLDALTKLVGNTKFIRVNRFYLLNRNHIKEYREEEKLLLLSGNYSLKLKHSIHPVVRKILVG